MKQEAAPGPDGFIGRFIRICWDIIKEDLCAAIQYFYSNHGQHFNLLNSSHIVLIPKTAEATKISDFSPISLISSIAKIISKLLANRLSEHLDLLISRNQSAFIRKRSIHDNFLYTQNTIRNLHRTHKPALFLKLDIVKAFDSVRWDYLLEVMEHMGFGPRWREWVTVLLSTTSSSVLVNGSRTQFFRHKIGLCKGIPYP